MSQISFIWLLTQFKILATKHTLCSTHILLHKLFEVINFDGLLSTSQTQVETLKQHF